MYYDSNKTRETFVPVGYFIHLGVYVFTKKITGTRVSEDFQFQVSGSRNNQKRTALLIPSK